MRLSTAPERALVAARRFRWLLRVELQGVDGGWRDMTNLVSRNWVNSCRWRWNLDQPVMAGELTLHRQINSNAGSVLSLSPLIAGSALNLTGAGGTAGPQVDVRRKLRISTATLAPGSSAPAAGDWKEVFQGYTDKYSLGGNDPTITIPFRDLGALLQNTIVEVERVYGSTGGTDGATVMQSILTDNASLLGVSITLAVPAAIPIAVYTYKLPIGTTIMDALNAIARKAGAVVRYKYNSTTNVFELTFYTPDRTKVIPDYTFAASEYLAFEELEADIAGLRNIVYVPYTDSGPGGTGARLVAVAQASPANLTQYGHLAMVLGQEATSQINTNTEAQNLANAAVADTAYPYSTARALHDLTWWVEGGDLLRYMPNNKHTDAQLDIAVMQIEHVIQASEKEVTARTTIIGRPNVAALYQTWLRLADGTGAGLDVPPALLVTDTPGASPALAHSVAYSGIYDSIELSINGGPWGAPAASPLSITPNPAGGVAKVLVFRATKSGQQTTQTVTIPAAGGAPSPPIITITQSSITAPTLSQETLTVAGSLGAGGAGPYQWRTRTLLSNTGSTPAWGAFSATPALPSELTITRALKWSKIVEVQAQDAAGVVSEAKYVVASKMEAMTDNGVVDDQHAASSGALLFRRTVDSTSDVVSVSTRGFIDQAGLDVSLRPTSVFRGSGYEPTANLFKRGTDSAADVVTTTTRTFVDPNSATQVDASGRIVGVYRLGVYEPVNNLVKAGDTLGFAGASSLTLTGSVAWKIVLSGSPTNVQQISFGDSSVSGAVGSQYSSGMEFISHNAYQNTYGADSWAQSHSGFKSALFEVGTTGLALYSAVAGKATAVKATFWGSAVFSVAETGNVNTIGYYFGASNRGIRIGNSFFGQQGSGYGEVGYNNSDGAGSQNYFVTDFASRIRFNSGGISFQTAPSGTAGGAITFTERMLITQAGAIITGGSTASVVAGEFSVPNNHAYRSSNVANSATYSLVYLDTADRVVVDGNGRGAIFGAYISAAGYVHAGTYFYADSNYGYGLVGAYDPTKYRLVYGMGAPYLPDINGVALGTAGGNGVYGLFCAFDNTAAGGYPNITTHSLGHGVGWVSNGAFQWFAGGGFWTSGPIYGASYTGGAVTGTNGTFSNQLQGASLVITGASATVAGYPVARVRSGTATSVPADLASGEVYYGY